jgi:hypothetical protein
MPFCSTSYSRSLASLWRWCENLQYHPSELTTGEIHGVKWPWVTSKQYSNMGIPSNDIMQLRRWLGVTVMWIRRSMLWSVLAVFRRNVGGLLMPCENGSSVFHCSSLTVTYICGIFTQAVKTTNIKPKDGYLTFAKLTCKYHSMLCTRTAPSYDAVSINIYVIPT